MRKSSTTTRRRSSSNPGRVSQNIPKSKDPDSMIPKPRIRSSSTDRLSGMAGMRKSNLRAPTTGGKQSVGQYTTGSSAASPMHNRYTYVMEKNSRPSLMDQANRGRSSYVDQNQKGLTPMTSGSRHALPMSDGKNVRASSAERASALAPKGPKKDNRPLTDKNYQIEMMNKIDSYFNSINQMDILNNNGSIKPLTLKIFVDATTLLVKLLDMKPTLTMSNYIEEIPKIAKKWHYPGQMSKSWLKTANTMHSWPHAIGWISWLVELCEVKDLATEIFTLDRLPIIGETEEEKENRRNMFLIMIQCYKAWNEEKPEEEERIIQQFFEKEAERRGISEERHKKACLEYEKALENLQREQTKTNKVDEELNELQQTLDSMRKDQAKQEEHIIEQEKYIEKTLREIEQLDKDSLMFKDDIENLEKSIEELNSIIKEQPMTVSERDEIVKACTEQQTYNQNFEAHLEEIRKEAYSLDMRLVSSNTNLVKTILAYNQDLFMQFSDTNINVDDFLMPESGLCEPDFIERLEDKKSLITTFVQERNKELSDKTIQIESHNREIEALQTKRDVLLEKVEKKKASEEKKKQEMKTKEVNKREDIKKLQSNLTDINEAVNKATNENELLQQELDDAIDKKEAVLRKNSQLKESAVTFFEQMNGILDNHRGKIKNSLEKYLSTNTK